MKKIGISTVHTGYNYGSALQAFATKMIIEELGYEGVNISLKGSLLVGRDVRVKKLIVIALRLLMQPKNIAKRVKVYNDNINQSYSLKTKEYFMDFRSEMINPYLCTWAELKRVAQEDDFEAFLCGSDQIWNSEALYVDPQYYLRYAPLSKRIAFAPSFGRDTIAKYNRKIIAKYINEIPHLSIREKSGVSLIQDLINRDATHLIDPTLFLDSHKWDKYLKISHERLDDAKYILAYFLNEPTILAKESMRMLADKENIKIIALPYSDDAESWFDIAPDAGPIQFVNYIKHASYVFTDSFHGTAFAVNYQVPFFTFDRQYGSAGKQSSRIESFLELVSLDERFNPSIDNLETFIDFSNSKNVLEIERKKVLSYLNNSLKSGGIKK